MILYISFIWKKSDVENLVKKYLQYRQTNEQTNECAYFDSFVDADSEYIYFIRSKMSLMMHCKLLLKMNIPSARVWKQQMEECMKNENFAQSCFCTPA